LNSIEFGPALEDMIEQVLVVKTDSKSASADVSDETYESE
jgi:hypothetical protein